MECERYSGTRVLAAYGEAADHVEACDFCAGEVDEMREIHRLYAARPTRGLNGRSRNRVLLALKRQSRLRRIRMAAAAATMLLAVALAHPGLSPVETVNADPAPAGAVIDGHLAEVRDRISDLEWDAGAPEAYFDSALGDVARRVELLSWDDENM